MDLVNSFPSSELPASEKRQKAQNHVQAPINTNDGFLQPVLGLEEFGKHTEP
jgi:hypothetical protein